MTAHIYDSQENGMIATINGRAILFTENPPIDKSILDSMLTHAENVKRYRPRCLEVKPASFLPCLSATSR